MNSFEVPFHSNTAPSGYTGAEGIYCDDCHSDFGLNTPGGSVTATGLPTSYQSGKAYDFSITVSQTAGAVEWGFSIKAVLANGTPVGTFSTTNTSCKVQTNELKTSPAVGFTGASYTFNNLRWTAPSSATGAVIFYIAAVAGDGSGSSGDYVYASSRTSSILPVVLEQFNAVCAGKAVQLEWKTSGENNFKHFEIERSADGANFNTVGTLIGAGGSALVKSYAFADEKLPTADAQLFYRLKIIDWDGNFEYSKVVRVSNPAAVASLVRVVPSVLHRGDPLQVSLYSPVRQQVTLSVYAVNGKKLFETVEMVSAGQNRIMIQEVTKWAAGTVLVQVKTTGLTETQKVIIQ